MSLFSGRRILLTGGTGFIGRCVTEALTREGAGVICLTRRPPGAPSPGVTYVPCDLRRLHELPAGWAAATIGPVDALVYLAASIPPLAQGREGLFEAKANNLDPLVLTLETFGALTGRIVFASTIDVYGFPAQENFAEDTAIAPASTYAVAKYCGEKYVETYCRMNSRPYFTLRFSQVYGPAEPLVRVTPFVIDALRHGKPFTLNGSGRDLRRFLYVDDAAAAVLLALRHDRDGLVNIAGGQDVSLLDLIGTAEKVWGHPLEVRQINADRPPVHLLPCIDKARRELGFQPRVDLATGLRRIHASFEQDA